MSEIIRRRIAALCVLSLLAGCVLGRVIVQCEEKEDYVGFISDPVPRWEIGDWWIVETTFIVSTSELAHGPEKMGILRYYHKYEVVKQERIGEKETWVVDVKAARVPSEEPNDHGDEYLWRLHLNKKDLSLVQMAWKIRSGQYLVSGQEVMEGSAQFTAGNPVIADPVPVLTPLDIPKLPSGEFPRFLSEQEKELQFSDEKIHREFVQYIVAVEETVDNKPQNVLYVTIYNEDVGIRTQRWVPGLPWWQEWRYATSNRFTDGMWYAKLIEWGSIEDKKPQE